MDDEAKARLLAANPLDSPSELAARAVGECAVSPSELGKLTEWFAERQQREMDALDLSSSGLLTDDIASALESWLPDVGDDELAAAAAAPAPAARSSQDSSVAAAAAAAVATACAAVAAVNPAAAGLRTSSPGKARAAIVASPVGGSPGARAPRRQERAAARLLSSAPCRSRRRLPRSSRRDWGGGRLRLHLRHHRLRVRGCAGRERRQRRRRPPAHRPTCDAEPTELAGGYGTAFRCRARAAAAAAANANAAAAAAAAATAAAHPGVAASAPYPGFPYPAPPQQHPLYQHLYQQAAAQAAATQAAVAAQVAQAAAQAAAVAPHYARAVMASQQMSPTMHQYPTFQHAGGHAGGSSSLPPEKVHALTKQLLEAESAAAIHAPGSGSTGPAGSSTSDSNISSPSSSFKRRCSLSGEGSSAADGGSYWGGAAGGGVAAGASPSNTFKRRSNLNICELLNNPHEAPVRRPPPVSRARSAPSSAVTSPPPGASPLAQSHPRLTCRPPCPPRRSPSPRPSPCPRRPSPSPRPFAGRRTPVEGAEENVGETLRHNFLPSLGGLDQL